MVRRLFQWLYGKSPVRKRPVRQRRWGFRPTVERLLDRITPTAFTWSTLPVNNNWEEPGNWLGSPANPNDYPGFDGTNATTGDTATIGGNVQVTMQNGHELASLTLQNTFTGTLTLQGQLTLNNGGTVAGGTIIQNAAGKNGPIHVTGGTFVWTGGNINYSPTIATAASTFSISGGATVRFAPTQAEPYFGSNISINSLSVLELSNPTPITLVNQPTITNSGKIDIMVSHPNGLKVAQGDTPTTIFNEGEIVKSADNYIYGIAHPLKNEGILRIDTGTLWFKGTDAQTQASVTNAGGSIQLNAIGRARLRAESLVKQTGGSIITIGAGWAYLEAHLTVSTGTVRLLSPPSDLACLGGFHLLRWNRLRRPRQIHRAVEPREDPGQHRHHHHAGHDRRRSRLRGHGQ